MPLSISRSQALCRFDYKRHSEEATSQNEEKQLRTGKEFPEDLFEHPLALKYNADPTAESERKRVDLIPGIGHIRVANPLFDNWSIAAESLDSHMFERCRKVVRSGVARSLNRPFLSPLTFVLAFKTTLRMELRWKAMGPEERLARLCKNCHNDNLVTDEKPAEVIVEELCTVMKEAVHAFADSFKNDSSRLDRLVGPVARHMLTDEFYEKIEAALVKVRQRTAPIETESRDDKKYVLIDAFLRDLFDALNLPGVLEETNPLGPAPIAYFHGKASESERGQPKLIVVDRREIEGTRFLRNLIGEHLKDPNRDKPLPIAVFGPPGSGKTFAVKKIIESIQAGEPKLEIEWVEDNLGQKTEFKQLDDTFQKITDKMADKKIPVVFFDEFDSSLEGNLGWLKLFLAPMEDGTYNGRSVGRSILVFAGGTSETFRAFSRQDLQKESKEWVDFTAAKGPDFVSRSRTPRHHRHQPKRPFRSFVSNAPRHRPAVLSREDSASEAVRRRSH